MVMRQALMFVVLATTTITSALATQLLNPDEERAQLSQSLEESCRQPNDDAHWIELDRCHRAWFRKNEEAVWRLKLNPHAGQGEPRS